MMEWKDFRLQHKNTKLNTTEFPVMESVILKYDNRTSALMYLIVQVILIIFVKCNRAFYLRNECLLSGFMGNESERGTNKFMKRFSDDLFVPPSDSFPMNPDKKTLIPYFYNVSNKDPS